MKKLVIIAGAAGKIGTQFCKALIENQIDCIAVIRNTAINIQSPYVREIECHLDSEMDVEKQFSTLSFEKYDQIIFLHTIGTDKFDPRGFPNIQSMSTIDPQIYNTNVNTFKYLMRYCVRKIEKINLLRSQKTQLKLAIIGGVADKHTPFVIESFCEAKFILRQYIQSQINLFPDWISGLSINITSTITRSALAVRPNANTEFWLTPEEVTKDSLNSLLDETLGYNEINIIKHNPNFQEGYYQNSHALYQKWSFETGIYS